MIFVIELLLEAFLIYKVWTERDRTRLFLWFMSAMILLYPNLKIMQGTPAVNWMFPVVCLLRIIKRQGTKKMLEELSTEIYIWRNTVVPLFTTIVF